MKNSKQKILIIEDEANISNLVSTVLETNGYKPLIAKNCGQGKMMFSSHIPDLVILDLGLPDEDGLNFIDYARANGNTPIIVLSARSDEHDKVEALDKGACDYVTKPFGSAEFLARVRAQLRTSNNIPADNTPLEKFVLHDLQIDFDKHTVTLNGEPVNLTVTEYNIVVLLSKYQGKVLTYTNIIKEIWGYQDGSSIKKLQVNMANIRKKLKIVPGNNKYILNELGVGYRMCDESDM
ncbi:MAG: response regulator transcription factor [Ruminococcaceae bacterium]|nr:response regulator transcription factor [Oscillospiraceae bacterium]